MSSAKSKLDSLPDCHVIPYCVLLVDFFIMKSTMISTCHYTALQKKYTIQSINDDVQYYAALKDRQTDRQTDRHRAIDSTSAITASS